MRVQARTKSEFAESPDDFSKLIADEINKWAKVIQFANIKAE
jgi:hypothetical protein